MKVSVRSSPSVQEGELVEGRKPFGRLKFPEFDVQHNGAAASLLRLPPSAPPSQVVEPEPTAVDSAKAFVGPNATFYDDCWRWMDWRGRHRSWNWSAAMTFGGWFAYRRMYRHAAAYALLLVCLAALAATGIPPEPLLGALLVVAVVMGLFGDKLYLLHFRRIARDVFLKHPEYDARVAALAKAGGVSQGAVWTLGGAVALGAVLAFILL